MAVLGSSGGGGAGDTYTASTAEAGIPVESGRSYALSSDGKLFPSNMLVAKQATHPVPNSVAGASGYQYALNVFGDMVTPDGKATFHFIADDGAGYYNIFYISLDGGNTNNGPVMNSSTGNPFNRSIGWGGSTGGNMYLKLLGEDDTYYYYIFWCNWYESSTSATNYGMGRGFMVKKSDHTFHTTGTDEVVSAQAPIWVARSSSASSNYQNNHDYASQNKTFFYTCRNKDIFVYTYGQYNMSTYGFMVGAVDTYRSSDSSYWGGTSMGLPKTSGHQYSNTTHRDNVQANSHLPLFKVDDANGIFIAPYYCDSGTNTHEHVFLKYTVAADHTITTSSEILIGGTDPAQGSAAYGHWIATTDPLIYYYLYHDASTSLYYTKCTWNSDWTAATWGTQAQLTLPLAMDAGYGTTYWATDRDHQNIGMKHSVPEKELFFMTGNNDNTDKSALALSFPATGTPSVLGTTTLNTVLGTSGNADYNAMEMQSLHNGTMFATLPLMGNMETYGYAIHYTDFFNPNFKKTMDKPAIARADGDAGDTVNIDLKTGDTATATLSTNFYVTKENMSYPLDVEGGTSASASAIKSIQRGITTLSSVSKISTSISKVNMDKSFISSGGESSGTRVELGGPTTINFTRTSSSGTAYISWEVIEFV